MNISCKNNRGKRAFHYFVAYFTLVLDGKISNHHKTPHSFPSRFVEHTQQKNRLPPPPPRPKNTSTILTVYLLSKKHRYCRLNEEESQTPQTVCAHTRGARTEKPPRKRNIKRSINKPTNHHSRRVASLPRPRPSLSLSIDLSKFETLRAVAPYATPTTRE